MPIDSISKAKLAIDLTQRLAERQSAIDSFAYEAATYDATIERFQKSLDHTHQRLQEMTNIQCADTADLAAIVGISVANPKPKAFTLGDKVLIIGWAPHGSPFVKVADIIGGKL